MSDLVERVKNTLAMFDLDAAGGAYESQLEQAARAVIAEMTKPLPTEGGEVQVNRASHYS